MNEIVGLEKGMAIGVLDGTIVKPHHKAEGAATIVEGIKRNPRNPNAAVLTEAVGVSIVALSLVFSFSLSLSPISLLFRYARVPGKQWALTPSREPDHDDNEEIFRRGEGFRKGREVTPTPARPSTDARKTGRRILSYDEAEMDRDFDRQFYAGDEDGAADVENNPFLGSTLLPSIFRRLTAGISR